ncbi:excisionase family DNA-binding protein [Nocardia shimofusensis]|uniref:excisionase family DNA-binding protein n=1 Tax=Nocardia shimofusensis TaxID=228596 RepID=UPI00082AD3F7|nr:excisionase family DNA-binding protein [Nocardia shimofusensis]
MTGFDREPRPEENRHHRTGRNTDRHRDTSPTGSPQRYISIGAAAEYASVSKDTIRRMIADGTLPAYRFRGQVRIAIEDVENAMRPIQ